MLLLALFFIVVATSLATLIMANSTQLMRMTRHEHEMMILQQLTDSGWDWVQAQNGLKLDSAVTLSGEGIVPDGCSGEVHLSPDHQTDDRIIITAEVRFPQETIEYDSVPLAF
jgi:hypothetical protein